MDSDTTVRHSKLEQLKRLTGTWSLEAVIDGKKVGGGKVVFEWIENGAFLRQFADRDAPPPGTPPEWVENSPEPVSTIIGLDDSSGQFTMLYADARNVFRVYQMTLEEDTWRVWRSAPGFSQRFTGTFSDDDNQVTGMWEASTDGESWSVDFHLNYKRVDGGSL